MEEDKKLHCEFLEGPISFKDLITSGTRMNVSSNYYNDDYIDVDDIDFNEEYDLLNVDSISSPWTLPFAELKEKMFPIGDGIFKSVVISGYGEPMPAKSNIEIDYNAYWEGEAQPFDSTFLRGKSMTFSTQQAMVLEGIELCALSMKKGEESQFIIPYQLMYGEIGCPPRIRGKADCLFTIKLLDFNETGNVDAVEQLTREQQREFSIIFDKILDTIAKGRDLFKQKKLTHAARCFRAAVDLLEKAHTKNEDEHMQQKQYIIKMYTNLAVIYNRLNEPKKACSMCNELKSVTNLQNNCKALFQEGRALLTLGDYDKAKKCLIRCLKLEPNNTEIQKELDLLHFRKDAANATEKEMCRKAFSLMNLAGPAKKDDTDDSLEQMLKQFRASNELAYRLPNTLLPAEIQTLEEIAAKHDMYVQKNPLGQYYLYKQ